MCLKCNLLSGSGKTIKALEKKKKCPKASSGCCGQGGEDAGWEGAARENLGGVGAVM